MEFVVQTDALTFMRAAVTLVFALACWTIGWTMVTRYIGTMIASKVRRFIVVAAINVAETWAAYTMAIVIGVFAVYGKALDLWLVALCVAFVQLATIVLDRIAGRRIFAAWAKLSAHELQRQRDKQTGDYGGRQWWLLWFFIPAVATMLFLVAMQ